jgi:alkylation response protein AidB-like acyl-CoA dehydrogenase
MNLGLTQRQRAFVAGLESLLADRPATTRWDQLVSTAPGYDLALWSELVAGRWVTVGFPEEFGGRGGGVSDMVLLAEVLGGGPVPGPLHAGIVLSGSALMASGDDERLRALLSGERTFTFCSWGSSDQSAVVATKTARGWRLDGRTRFVPYGADAGDLLVLSAVQTGAGVRHDALFALDRSSDGVATEEIPDIGGDRLAHITFSGVEVDASALVGEPGAPEGWMPAVVATGRVVMAAEMAGAAAAALSHACEWARTRVQFQAPIGSLQAVQQRLADAFIDVVTARDAVYDAAGIVDREEAATAAAAGAKAYCSEACRRVTASAHQVSGGEGIYADQPLHAWHRRVQGLVPLLGGVQTLRAVVAETVLPA